MSTTILIYVLVVLLAINSISAIGMIDIPREPLSRSQAIFTVVINGMFIFWLLSIIN